MGCFPQAGKCELDTEQSLLYILLEWSSTIRVTCKYTTGPGRSSMAHVFTYLPHMAGPVLSISWKEPSTPPPGQIHLGLPF